MEFRELLSLLHGVKGAGNQYTAKCPAHDDQTASLSVALKDGKILANCFAGCSFEAIAAALNLPARAFFTDFTNNTASNKKQRLRTITYEYKGRDGSLAYRKQRREYDDGTKNFDL